MSAAEDNAMDKLKKEKLKALEITLGNIEKTCFWRRCNQWRNCK